MMAGEKAGFKCMGSYVGILNLINLAREYTGRAIDMIQLKEFNTDQGG